AQKTIKSALGGSYIVALNSAPTTPEWLVDLGAEPMKLGLDLSGGVHFLMEVDTASAIAKRQEITADEMKEKMRKEKVRYSNVESTPENIVVAKFRTAELREEALDLLRGDYPNMMFETPDAAEGAESFEFTAELGETAVREIEDYALSQNLITLRN